MTRRHWDIALSICVLLLPVLTIRGVAFLSGGPGPRTAVAVPPDPARTPPPSPPHWTARQLEAARYVEQLRTRPYGASPLLHATARMGSTPVDASGRRLQPPPVIRVQVIWSSANGNLALVDGKQYREGDTIGDAGWVVREIDMTGRAVTIEHPETKRSATVPIDRKAG